MPPPPAQAAEGARGRAQAAVASAGLAGRAHPGLPEHGQRRRARGAAVGASSAARRGAARPGIEEEPTFGAPTRPAAHPPSVPWPRGDADRSVDDGRRQRSGGVASKRSTPPETTARAPSPTSSAPSSPSARMSSRRAGRAGAQAAGGGLGQAAHDEPRERRRQVGEVGERDAVAAGQRGVDDDVEHLGLLAQQLGGAHDVGRRARVDRLQRRRAGRGARARARSPRRRWWRRRARPGRARGTTRRSPRA